MQPDLALEAEFFERFARKGRAERFVGRLCSPKKRARVWSDLRDTRYFEPACVQEIVGEHKERSSLTSRLRALGMSDVLYVLSNDEEYDGTRIDLEVAIGLDEVLAYCSKSKLGFFRNHEDWCYVLQRA